MSEFQPPPEHLMDPDVLQLIEALSKEADRIEELEAENERLRAALERIANFFPDDVALLISGEAADMKDVASEVLAAVQEGEYEHIDGVGWALKVTDDE